MSLTKILLKVLPVVAIALFVSPLVTLAAPGDFATGLVSLSFDDGTQSIYDNARSILNGAGYKSTQYIISGAMGCADLGGVCPDFMTSAEVNAFKAEGHEIAAHTRTDPCPPAPDPDACASGVGSRGLPANELLSQVDGLRLYLLQGIGTPVNTFAYPFGEYDDTLVAKLKSAGIVGARTVDFIDALGQPTFNTTSSDRYKLAAVQINVDTPITSTDILPAGWQANWGYVEQWIDTAIANKKWLILVFHEIQPTATGCGTEVFCITQDKLSTIVAYLQSKGSSVSVVTVGQGLAQMTGNPVSNALAPIITINEASTSTGAVTVEVASPSSSPVTFTPVVTDDDTGLPSSLNAFCTIPTLQYPSTGHPTWGVNFPTVVSSGSVFPMGTTTVTCTSADTGGHIGSKVFNVVVKLAPDITPPTLAQVTAVPNPANTTPNYTFSSSEAGTITYSGSCTSSTTAAVLGNNTVTFNTLTVGAHSDCTITVKDAANNVSLPLPVNTFTVDASAPVLTLNGVSPMNLAVGQVYTEPGATGVDDIDATVNVVVGGATVNTSVVGTYVVTYNAVDSAGNTAAQITRTVVVSNLNLSLEQASSASTDSVTLAWTTSHPATSRVVYDIVSHNPVTAPAPNYGYSSSTVEDATLVTDHSVTVNGLTAGTTYYLRPVSHGSPETVGDEISVATQNTPSPSASGSGSATTHRTQGQYERRTSSGIVLGATAVATGSLGQSCGLYMDKFMRSGINNDPDQVKKLQAFLNKWMDANLDINGSYDLETTNAVKAFQEKYASEVLAPWGLTAPTGLVYKTTLRKINMLECPNISLVIPSLVSWSTKPATPKTTLEPNSDTKATDKEILNVTQVAESQPAAAVESTKAPSGLWGFIKGLLGR